MHYKNGREAKEGDIVVNLPLQKAGIVTRVNTGADTCNARLTPLSENDPYISLKECLHIDDINAANVPDTTPSTIHLT